MFDRCYCITSTIYLLKFGNLRIKIFKMAAIIRFDLYVSKITLQGGCCTTVVVQNDIQIHQQNAEKGLPFYTIISMLNKPYPILCHHAVLGSRNVAACFLSQLFYSEFDTVKHEDSIVFNSVSRHEDGYTKK